MNYAPLRGVPGVVSRVPGDVGPLCRRCGRETETSAYAAGSCSYKMLLVTRRHHRVKNAIRGLLEPRRFTCFDEVYALDTEGASRYADIVGFDSRSDKCYVLDPTIRLENNDMAQAEKINAEKRGICVTFTGYLQEKFHERFGDRRFVVSGLWFGSRGMVPPDTVRLLFDLGADPSFITNLCEGILVDTVGIINHHLHS